MDIIELHNSSSTYIKNIHDFLQNGDQQITYRPNKEIVLLLGNTGSGKSTLAHYISGNDHKLISQEVEEGTEEFLIVDQEQKISNNSTIVSQTNYPDLVEDYRTNTTYYDCPGFSDTRSAAHEIAATYFIKKVIDSASAVKIIFVVSRSSVSKGKDRQGFILMLHHATDLIKQMDKFKNSIALVVTKIENRYVRGKMVPDEVVINSIGSYLEQAKRDIVQHPEMVTAGKSSDTKQKVLTLLDIFLNRGENGQYSKIGIFREPNQPGPLSEIELLKEGKIPLGNLINKNIQFVEVGNKDFGYTVSEKSKLHIIGLVEEVNKIILKQLLDMGKEIEKMCISQEKEITDLLYLSYKFQKLQKCFSKIQDSITKDTISPGMFINEIEHNIKTFNIDIPEHYLIRIRREGDYIDFLNLVINQSIKNNGSSILGAGLSNLTEFLNDLHSFYSLLNDMYQRLSEYDIQKNRKKYNTLHVNELSDLYQSPIFIKLATIFITHSCIMLKKVDQPKLEFLNRVLHQTLNYQIESTSPRIDKIVIKGMNVMLSDVPERLNSNVKFLEVYALHKVFIDTTLDLTGREIQMVIVAPVWEIVGNQSIILDGPSGHNYGKARLSPHENKTPYNFEKDGCRISTYNHGFDHYICPIARNGSDGQPGEPGGPAGNFIGIGKQFINEEYLRISANGGKGGRGEDGGDGEDGTSRFGPTNKDGGNGGDGGRGGYGGHKGSILLYKSGTESGIVRANLTALDGRPGEDGEGGRGGAGGRHNELKGNWFHRYIIYCDSWGQLGRNGYSGRSRDLRNFPRQSQKVINIDQIKAEYKNYLQQNVNNNIQQSFLTTFLYEIDKNITSLSQPKNRKKRNVMYASSVKKSEERLKNIKKYSKLDPIEIQLQSYEQYVNGGKDEYYLKLNNHSDTSAVIDKPFSSNFFLETERIKPTPSRPIFLIPEQLENEKTEKNTNINDHYSSINLHGNLLMSEIVLKKFMGKETELNNDYKRNSKEGENSAHDLAYRYYLGNR